MAVQPEVYGCGKRRSRSRQCAPTSGLTSYCKPARSRRGLAWGTGGSAQSEDAGCPVCEVNRFPRVRPHITGKLSRKGCAQPWVIVMRSEERITPRFTLANLKTRQKTSKPIGVNVIAKVLRDMFSRSFCHHLRAWLNLWTSHIILSLRLPSCVEVIRVTFLNEEISPFTYPLSYTELADIVLRVLDTNFCLIMGFGRKDLKGLEVGAREMIRGWFGVFAAFPEEDSVSITHGLSASNICSRAP